MGDGQKTAARGQRTPWSSQNAYDREWEYGRMLLDEDLGVCEAVLGRYWLS